MISAPLNKILNVLENIFIRILLLSLSLSKESRFFGRFNWFILRIWFERSRFSFLMVIHQWRDSILFLMLIHPSSRSHDQGNLESWVQTALRAWEPESILLFEDRLSMKETDSCRFETLFLDFSHYAHDQFWPPNFKRAEPRPHRPRPHSSHRQMEDQVTTHRMYPILAC